MMYINGGSGTHGEVLSDTWQLDLTSGGWRCLHQGIGADAIPREKHSLFVCGEALLLVGGCSPSMFNERVAGKFSSFVAVLPLVPPPPRTPEEAPAGDVMPCWIPVAMGNVSIVAPSKKSFGAAFGGGFVYVFGGMSGAEPATNSTVRFLAADGYVSADARATTAANDLALRSMLQQLRERSLAPYDTFLVPSSCVNAGGGGGEKKEEVDWSATSVTGAVGLHRALLQQRAPQLWAALQECRSEPCVPGCGLLPSHALRSQRASVGEPAASAHTGGNSAMGTGGDVVDALMREMGNTPRKSSAATVTTSGGDASASAATASSSSGVATMYFTNGTARVKGLAQPLTPELLSCLADYLVWGGLRGEYRLLLEEEEESREPHTGAAAPATVSAGGATSKTEGAAAGGGVIAVERARLESIVSALRTVAATYHLPSLQELCEALLAGDRRRVQKARALCTAALRKDVVELLNTCAGATMTVLFVDPHTKQQSAHALHPFLLTSASTFFADLLRPLLSGDRSTFQIGPVAAKLTGAAGATASKRAILVGPVSMPRLAVPNILRFLYSQELRVPRETAFETMLGAHQLGLPLLQAYCEAVVAREEVNYDTCCSFFSLARKYAASLLEEMSLLTAVSGYAEVKHTMAYLGLSEEEKQSIDVVVAELGSDTWVPPPQPTQELKPASTYEARFNAASATAPRRV